jgi:hypothetical protein
MEKPVTFDGLLIKDNVKLIDFNYQILKDLEKNELIIKPWKILTLKF